MTPIKRNDGWWVELSPFSAMGPFKTSADAWRWIDRRDGEPISPSEKRAQYLNGED